MNIFYAALFEKNRFSVIVDLTRLPLAPTNAESVGVWLSGFSFFEDFGVSVLTLYGLLIKVPFFLFLSFFFVEL